MADGATMTAVLDHGEVTLVDHMAGDHKGLRRCPRLDWQATRGQREGRGA